MAFQNIEVINIAAIGKKLKQFESKICKEALNFTKKAVRMKMYLIWSRGSEFDLIGKFVYLSSFKRYSRLKMTVPASETFSIPN